jgi:type III secretion protein V
MVVGRSWRGGRRNKQDRRDVGGWILRRSDLALAALVIGIVAMMIVPLPTLLLDLLISLNIAGAVTLLLVSIYVGDALKIATFPTLLLLTTLFRLAIEVSATRLILLRADAGEVIHAFGAFVVAGNLVVGAVVFVILTVIQFIVISKGSERVAEVAARFALDALPGRQMAIDGELRAGLIDGAQARRRRAALDRESQLYGAMDGAMKFVKGDAVAGLVVLAVNIVGGLIIGVLQRGLALPAAARTYTVLTIGEGLVAQIPALIISTAAGIIVTRVAAEDDGDGDGQGTHLAQEIAGQVLGQPKAIAMAAALLAGLGLVPGLPFVPFVLLAAVLGLVARARFAVPHRGRRAPLRAGGPNGAVASAPAATALDDPSVPLMSPVEIELGPRLGGMLGAPAEGAAQDEGDGGDPRAFAARLGRVVHDRLFAELGIPLPPPRVRATDGASTGPDGYVIRLNEVPLGRGEIPPERPDAEEVLAEHASAVLRRYGHELVGIEETQALLSRLQRSHPALVREVVPRIVSPGLLTDVLRRLVAEGISLRNLKDVLGALASASPAERDPVILTEKVRVALRRAITHRHADGAGVVSVLALDPMIEDAVRDAVHKTDTGSTLALEPQLSREIIEAVGRAVTAATRAPAPSSRRPVILASADIRRYVRRLIETAHPELAVLSHPELAPEAAIESVGIVAAG